MAKPLDLPRALELHFSIDDAVERTSICKTKIKDALRNREIAFRKIGTSKRGRILIPESALVAWLERTGQYFPSVAEARS